MPEYFDLEQCIKYLHDHNIITEVCFANLMAEIEELYHAYYYVQEIGAKED